MQLLFWLLLTPFLLQECVAKSLNYKKLMNINSKCRCGNFNSEIESRIVHGVEAKEHAYPWLVAILNNNRMHCGGSLINDRYVLTAGHCLNWSNKDDLTVILGMHDRVLMETEKKGGTIMHVESAIVHEDFSSDYLHDTEDIALIKLKEPVSGYSVEVNPVCLPFGGLAPENHAAIVAGWGRTSQSGSPAHKLQEASVDIMTNAACRNISTVGEHITPTMMCAMRENTDACQGDSGGPLIWASRNRSEQIGVVSWGIGCAKKGVPGIYTRVTKYLEWIVAHTRDATYCEDPANPFDNN